jgi:hypothetical protein
MVIPEDQAAPVDLNARINSLEEVIKRISESMEAMKKTNEDLVSRLPLRKQLGHEERHKLAGKEKCAIRRKKALFTVIIMPGHIARKILPTKSLIRLKTLTEQSSEEASSYQPSRHSRSHRS